MPKSKKTGIVLSDNLGCDFSKPVTNYLIKVDAKSRNRSNKIVKNYIGIFGFW